MVYTIQERSDIVIIYVSENRCDHRTAQAFNDKYPGKNVSNRYLIYLVHKFLDTGSVCNKKINNQEFRMKEHKLILLLISQWTETQVFEK